MSEETKEPLATKVVLLGETAVGKSCLISRFVNNQFQSNFVPTMGGCYSSKEVNYPKLKKKLKYEIWDTAGQEKYRAINKIFYQDAAVAILVYDITRKDSFEELKNYWYIEVRDNSPKDVIIAIAANKSDLYEFEEVSNDDLKSFAESINAIYKETSALNGTGINELFDNIGYKLLSPGNYDEMNNSTNKSIRLNKSNASFKVGDKSEVSAYSTGGKKNCC